MSDKFKALALKTLAAAILAARDHGTPVETAILGLVKSAAVAGMGQGEASELLRQIVNLSAKITYASGLALSLVRELPDDDTEDLVTEPPSEGGSRVH